ncbi:MULTISPECIES: glycosyl hydrolase-related protein [Cryobacterium]|uniref:glycosyl hydrolase-related protein n=1 Tax=Cryobacterium TaxID=69578 RepID=UPI0008C29FCE|nr:glycosyl hydrolase-related protein [Cryobacterium sp. TMT1-3]SEN73785.1 alpha-mannosidase [Cryobacterium luteum]
MFEALTDAESVEKLDGLPIGRAGVRIHPAVVIEAVKPAEDDSGDVILRVYEAHGTRAGARVIRSFDATGAFETDLLERRVAPNAIRASDDAARTLELRPFQLLTLRYQRT